MSKLAVGIDGCSPATQAAHLAALGSLPEMFRVVSVADDDPTVAREVAQRTGAGERAPGEVAPGADVVLVAGPVPTRAGRVERAFAGGARAVLSESPLSFDSRVAKRTEGKRGLLVCLAHLHDPAWQAALERTRELARRAALCRVTTAVEPLAGIVAGITQAVETKRPGDLDGAPMRRPAAPGLRELAWGPLLEDLALVRSCFGAGAELLHSRFYRDGYEVMLRAGSVPVHMTGHTSGTRRTEWAFELLGPGHHRVVRFPPPLLPGRPATVADHSAAGTVRSEPVYETGYRAAWKRLHEVALSGAPPEASSSAEDIELLRMIVEGVEGGD